MHAGKHGGNDCAPEPNLLHDEYPASIGDIVEKHEEKCSDLYGRSQLAEQRGAQVPNGVGYVEHRAHHQHEDVAAEHQHCDSPCHVVGERKHKKERAQQQLVGDRIEILPKFGPLVQQTCQQAVKSVAQPRQNEKRQSQLRATVKNCDDDERNKKQPQQGEEVGSAANLANHEPASVAARSVTPPFSPATNSENCRPVFQRKRSESEGMSPLRASSSMRSTRCMGKKTAPGLTGSPNFTWRAKSSREFRSMPRTLMPAGTSSSNTPQNFSRGAFNVTSTI